MAKSIIIIGSGIAGLTSGIYARMNGFETDIYEMHSAPGGLCTAWKKKDYTFDGCVHWLTGTSPESSYYRLWEELGCVQGQEFYNYEYFSKIKDEEGNICTLYTDPDKLEKEFISIAPEDSGEIRALIRDLKKFMKLEIPVDISLGTILRLLPVIRLYYKYRCNSKKLSEKFKSQRLQKIFIEGLDWNGMPSAFLLWSIGLMAGGNGAYPMGGSLALIRPIVERFMNLGGRIHFHSPVDKILTLDNKVVGIRLKNGEVKHSDIVISAADGHSTIYNWLEGKYTSRKIDDLYKKLTPFNPLVYISLGIKGAHPEIPMYLTFPLKESIFIGKEEIKTLWFKNYSYDRKLCPEGKSILIFMRETSFEHWEELKKEREKYLAEKQRIAGLVVRALDDQYPGISADVEVTDFATPMTFVRYTGNWKGSYQGWLLSKKSMITQLPQILPGLKDFYMAGHWISPGGGLPSGLITGRKAIKMICKKEGRRFAGIKV